MGGGAPAADATESLALRTLRELFTSGRPLVYLRSAEEQRIALLLRDAARGFFASPVPVWTWSLTEGMRRDDGTPTGKQPLGARVPGWFDRQDRLRAGGLFETAYAAADGLRLRQEAVREAGSAEGWEVLRQLVTVPSGLRWTEEVDPLVLALISGADGSVTLRDQVAVLAAAHEIEEDVLAEVLAPVVAHLVEREILTPVPTWPDAASR